MCSHINKLKLLTGRIIFSCSVAGLAVIGISFLSPSCAETAKAQTAADARANDMSLSLEIGGAGLDEETGALHNTVAFRGHSVTITASNIEDFLLILDGPTNLTSPEGSSTIIAGANGKTGSELDDNTWGYAYGNDSGEVLDWRFYSLTGQGITIDHGLPSSHAVNQTKNLFFAAKFGDDAEVGEYKAEVSLSLVANPRKLPMAGITRMQDMTTEICAASEDGETAVLLDDRAGQKSYTVRKFGAAGSVGRGCWMLNNLAFNLQSGVTLTSSDTDLSRNWTPNSTTQASTANSWTSSFTAVMSRMSNYDGNGNFYTWCAATAGGCSSATTANSTSPSSICPQRWTLPTGGGDRSLSPNGGTGQWGTWLNGLSHLGVMGEPYLMPPAGNVNTDGTTGGEFSYGYYWSKTSVDAQRAYILYFDAGNFNPGNNGDGWKSLGFSVRCVAK